MHYNLGFQKNLMWRTTQNLFNNWRKSKPRGKRTVPFLMWSCSVLSLVSYSSNGHMQKSTSCYLRL